MLIHISDRKLAKHISSEKEMIRAYGPEQARVLCRRLQQLRAVKCLAELRHLPQVHAHELSANRSGQIAITLKQPYRLILVPANNPIPQRPDGGLDWEAVTEVRIVEVVNYHND